MLQQHAHVDRLSRALFFVAFFVVAAAPAMATNIFSDGFENATFGPRWSVYESTTGTNQWLVSTAAPFAGTRHAQVTQPGTSRTVYLQANVSTAGYSTVNVSWYRQVVGYDGPDEYTAEWYDGTTWTAMEASGASSMDDSAYSFRNYTLPAGAGDKTNFAIRFTCLAGAVSEICRVDNVSIDASSTPLPPPPQPTTGQFNYTVTNQSGKFSFNLQPQYMSSGSMKPVNRTLVPSNLSGYEYGVTTGVYEAHFKNLPSTTSSILLRSSGIDLSYDPNGLFWDSSAGNDIIDANPNGAGDPDPVKKNVFVYPDAYGTGINLTYEYLADRLKETIVVANRAALGNPSSGVAAGANLSLRTDFAVHNTYNLDFYVDGVLWTSNGIKENVTSAQLKNGSTVIFDLPQVYARDSAGNTVYGWYRFRRTLGDVWVEAHIPFSWVNSTNRSYPIYFDPTTEIEGLNGTVVLNLSDPTFNPLVQVTLFNVTDGGATNILIIDPLENDTAGAEEYALDPSGLSYDYGVVFVSQAQGDILYKCPTFNITTGDCNPDANGETWIRAQSIVRGQNYSFTINNTDPGYYEYNTSLGEVSNLGTTFVTVANKTFNITRTGTYIVLATWQQRADSISNQFYERSKLDGTIVNELVKEAKDSSATNEYRTYGTQYVTNFTAGSSHWFSIEHATSNAGTTSFIKGIQVTIFDIGAYPVEQTAFAANESNVTINGSFVNVTTNTYTPNMATIYAHIASSEVNLADAGNAIYVQTGDDALTTNNFTMQPKDVLDRVPLMSVWGENETISSESIWLSAKKNGANTALAQRTRVTAFNLVSETDPHAASLAAPFSTTSTSFVQVMNLSFVPAYSNTDYLVLVSGGYSEDINSHSNHLRIQVNGVTYCDAPLEPKVANDYNPFICQALVNSSITVPFVVNVESFSDIATSTALVNNMNILVFALKPLSNNTLYCNPLLNVNWTINEPIICDNVTRTTGTGQIFIGANGTLELRNGAQIYTTGSPVITRWGANPWFIMMQRGSNIYATH